MHVWVNGLYIPMLISEFSENPPIRLFTIIYFLRLTVFMNYGPVLVVNVTKILTYPKSWQLHTRGRLWPTCLNCYMATVFNQIAVCHDHTSPAKMSECTAAYFDTQERLTTWNDELKFLGYILCEVINKQELDATGFRCHQAADLPAIIRILCLQSKKPNGTLTTIMADNELQIFRRLMRKVKEIRNLMAHHQIWNDDKLNDSMRCQRAIKWDTGN